jgi:hypothetical protein
LLLFALPLFAEKPVIVELFTSEGCSSCPPADQVLMNLGELPGVIVLSEHVDYWNSLGWKDPFSNHLFSLRQEEYARVFQLDSNYTPQMVVDGGTQFVGSDQPKAMRAIRSAVNQPKGDVSVEWRDGKLMVQARTAREQDQLVVAITEGGLHSSVARGENEGRVLPHTGVVRWMKTVGVVRGGMFQGEVPVAIARDWKRQNLTAIAFLQNKTSRAIAGAASVPLTSADTR